MKKFISILILASIVSIVSFSTTCLAANNDAYAIAGGADDLLVASNNNFIRSSYMSAGFNALNIQNPSSTLLASILRGSPKVFHTFSHGSANTVTFLNSGLQTGSNVYLGTDMTYYGVQRYSWSDTKLAVLTACNTAGNNDDNIANQIYKQMNNVNVAVIGWPTLISMDDAGVWVKYFHRKMAQGEAVSPACIYANSFIYNDTRLKQAKVYGSLLANVVNSSDRVAKLNTVYDEKDDNRKHNINYEVSYQSEIDLDNITNMLKKEFTNFNSENYKVEITTNSITGMTIIDYILTLGDFSTISGYTIFVENGKVTEVYDNTIAPISSTAQANLSSIESIAVPNNIKSLEEKSKAQASQKILNTFKGSSNSEQTTKLFYDVATGKKYIIVTTTNILGETKALISNYYEIN